MAQPPRKTVRQTTEPEAVTPLTILLAENNPGDVRLTKERFAEACIPCTIHVARTLDGTLAFLDERSRPDAPCVDAVLLDGRLTTEGDESLLRRLTAEYADVPLFLLVQTETEAELIDVSGRERLPHLTKPVDPNDVRDRVHEYASDEGTAARRALD